MVYPLFPNRRGQRPEILLMAGHMLPGGVLNNRR